MEYDREGYRYDGGYSGYQEASGMNPSADDRPGDYYAFDNGIVSKVAASGKGVAETDCLMCHLVGPYNNQQRNYCASSVGVGTSFVIKNGPSLALTLSGEVSTTTTGNSSDNPSCDILGYADGIIEGDMIARSNSSGCALCHFPDMPEKAAGTKAAAGPSGDPLSFTAFQKKIAVGGAVDSDYTNGTTTNQTEWKWAKGRVEFGKRAERWDATDVHMAAGLGCADCHYALEGDFDALAHNGEDIQVAMTVNKIDHQFAKGNNNPDGKNSDQLDNTVTCESCHIDGTHPNKGNATVPAHTGLPANHLAKIDCRTCHIPTLNFMKKVLAADFSSSPYPEVGIERNQVIANPAGLGYKPLYMWMDNGHKTGEYRIKPVAIGSTFVWKDNGPASAKLPLNKRFATSFVTAYRADVGDTDTDGKYDWTINSPQGGDTAIIVNTADEIAGVAAKIDAAGSVNMDHAALNIFVNQFSISHNVGTAPLGAGGCVDCHTANNSPLFSAQVMTGNAFDDAAGYKGQVFRQPADGGVGLEMTCDADDCTTATNKRITSAIPFPCPDAATITVDLTADIDHGDAVSNVIPQEEVLCYDAENFVALTADMETMNTGFHALLSGGPSCLDCHKGDAGPAANCADCHDGSSAVTLSADTLAAFATAYHDNAPTVNGAAPEAWDAETMNAANARFNWYKAPACNTISVDACMNEGSSFTWTSDGTEADATACATTIEFASAGLWNVTLTTATGIRSQWVNVSGTAAQPTAAMDVVYNGAAEPLTITVTDNSGTNGCASENGSTVSSIIWGDGTVTTGVETTDEVEHTYTVAGTYVVRLSTRDSGNGRKSVSAPVTVVVPDSAGSVFDITGTILKHPAVVDDPATLEINESAVKNVNVYLKNSATGTMVKHQGTDKDGVYTFSNVAPLPGDANYTIEPVKSGYTFGPAATLTANSGEKDVNGVVTGKDFSAHTAW